MRGCGFEEMLGGVCVCCDGCVVDGRGVCELRLGCWVRTMCAGNEMGPGGATEVAGALRGNTTLTSLALFGKQQLCCGVGVMWREDMVLESGWLCEWRFMRVSVGCEAGRGCCG